MSNEIDFNNLIPVNTGKKNLGSGAYASVCLVTDKTTGLKYALKEVTFFSMCFI
jgi:hypothetical protein